MQMRWRNYLFPVNGVRGASRTRLIKSDSGIPYALDGTIIVSGFLEGTSQANLTQLQLTLEAALQSNPYGDLVLLQDSGAPSATRLYNSNALSGVCVVDGPNFPGQMGNEYANQRQFDFTVNGQFPLAGSKTNVVLSFQESLTVQGGGPERAALRAVNKKPVQIQELYGVGEVEVVATQRGSATGYLRHPQIPPPLFPGLERGGPMRNINSPHRMGQGYEKFMVSWEYTFIAAVDVFNSLPHFWTNP